MIDYPEYMGKSVSVRHKDGRVLRGEILKDKDWLVGCPVFKSNDGELIGVGYYCDVIAIHDEQAR